jgi:hypothetical protein
MSRVRAPRKDLRALGLIDEAADHAVALRLIGLGLSMLGHEHGRAVVVTSQAIAERLDKIKAVLARGK